MDPVTGNGETVCKVRGITLNYSASQTVNFDVMKALILRGDDTETVTVHTEHKIKRKRADGRINIVTEPEDKIYNKGHFMASTDLGDLSHIIPVIQPMMGGIKGGLHSPDFEVVDYNAAITLPAKIAANTIIDLLTNDTLSTILESYKPELSKEEYIQLMDKDINKE